MKTTKKLSVVLVLLALLLAFSACTSSGSGDTTPSTDPVDTTAPPETTLPPVETTVPTEPEEAESPTEPEETEPQLQFQDRELDGESMNELQLWNLYWSLAEDNGGWYEILLGLEFTDPKDIHFYQVFGCGIPNEREPAYLTSNEVVFLTKYANVDSDQCDISRIPRETVETVLYSYFNLSPEDFEQLDLEHVPYMDETDCYYGLNNSWAGVIPIFQEGYRMDDGTMAIYYTRAGCGDTIYRAVFQKSHQDRDVIIKVLQITKVDP